MRVLITIGILTMLAGPAIGADAKPTPEETAKAALKDLTTRVYKAKILQDQTNAELIRLKAEAKQTKILKHEVETKEESEARISEESMGRMMDLAAKGLVALLSLILSFFGMGAWKDMSAKEKLRRVGAIVEEAIALADQKDKTVGAKGKEKKKIAMDHVEKLKTQPHLKVKGDVDWDSHIESQLAK